MNVISKIKSFIDIVQFTYLKNKLDYYIKNSKGFGFCDFNNKIVFNKKAYGRIAVEERGDGTFGVIYFYLSKNYVIFRYNFCRELNSNSIERYRIVKKINAFKYNSLSSNHLKDTIHQLYSSKESYNLYLIFKKYPKLYSKIYNILNNVNR